VKRTGRFLVLPPRLVLLLLGGAGIAHWALDAQPILRHVLAGALLIVLAVVLNIWADRVFKAAHTPVRPDEIPIRLVTRGPFAWSRNPMYVGLVLLLLGAALVVGTVPFWFLPGILWLVLATVFVRHEELVLREQFGAEFDTYCRTVNRWFGVRRGQPQ
jgi:protein-S-isoprenylcysteine O-methyltransferase Ste14